MSVVTRPARVVDTIFYEETGILFSDFTDGGGAAGTYVCGFELPVGFVADYSEVRAVTGFAGNTSATITVGDGSDVDRYNTGTPSVFTTIAALALGVASGIRALATANKPTITVTGNSDFTAVNAGALSIRIYGHMAS